MHWLFVLLAFGALIVAFSTPHTWLLVTCLVAALVFIIAWIRGWYSDRMGDQQRDEMSMIDPLELKRLREQAEARKREQAAKDDDDTP